MKCFCGKKAVYMVRVEGHGDSKFLHCPRCEECAERAKRSYEKVHLESLEK